MFLWKSQPWGFSLPHTSLWCLAELKKVNSKTAIDFNRGQLHPPSFIPGRRVSVDSVRPMTARNGSLPSRSLPLCNGSHLNSLSLLLSFTWVCGHSALLKWLQYLGAHIPKPTLGNQFKMPGLEPLLKPPYLPLTPPRSGCDILRLCGISTEKQRTVIVPSQPQNIQGLDVPNCNIKFHILLI